MSTKVERTKLVSIKFNSEVPRFLQFGFKPKEGRSNKMLQQHQRGEKGAHGWDTQSWTVIQSLKPISLPRWKWTERVGLVLKVYTNDQPSPTTPPSYKTSPKTIRYLFSNSFSTALNINFRRSFRLEMMFFEILFWCRVLFSHAIPVDTRTWQPFSLEGKSSIWYLRWSFKKMKES